MWETIKTIQVIKFYKTFNLACFTATYCVGTFSFNTRNELDKIRASVDFSFDSFKIKSIRVRD